MQVSQGRTWAPVAELLQKACKPVMYQAMAVTYVPTGVRSRSIPPPPTTFRSGTSDTRRPNYSAGIRSSRMTFRWLFMDAMPPRNFVRRGMVCRRILATESELRLTNASGANMQLQARPSCLTCGTAD